METQSIRLLIVSAMLCLTAQAQNLETNFSAVIKGQVLSVEGLPVSLAAVCANMVPERHGAQPCVQADAAGKFSIQIEHSGRYVISAWQEEKGYPNRWLGAYGPPAVPSPEIVIEDGTMEQSVSIYVGPKAGRLTAQVFSAETNQPIENGQLHLVRENAETSVAFVMQSSFAGGKFQIPVPAGPFILKVSAAGYKDWQGDGRSKEQADVLMIGPGDMRKMTILLQPTISQ